MEQTIYRATTESWVAFRLTVDLLAGQTPDYKQQHLDLMDEFEVFRAWARSSGANSQDHASLDYRLRENMVTWRLFITILENLSLGLLRCVSLVQPASSSPPALVSASQTTPPVSDGDSTSDESGPIPTLTDFLHDVSSSIDKLVQISRAVKKASAQSNSMKAEAYEEWENTPTGRINKSKAFEDFISILLEHRYRNLHDNVRDRLKMALSRCNRRIAYQRRHQRALRYESTTGGYQTSRSSVATKIPTVAPSHPALSGNDVLAVTSSQSDYLEVTQSLVGTRVSASTLSPAFNPYLGDDASSLSAGSSVSRMTGDPLNDLPPPPVLEGAARYFQCPYCYIQLPRKRSKRRAWTHHVISDLQPYVCVFDECPHSNQGYETERGWVEHERWYHDVSWSCDGFKMHSPVAFRSQGEFRKHFETSHAGIFSSSDINKHLEVAAVPSDELFSHCPFCDYTIRPKERSQGQDPINENQENTDSLKIENGTSQRRIRRHILDHLLSLFQLALPPRSDVAEGLSRNSISKVDAQSDRDPLEDGLDLVDSHYLDPEYAEVSLHEEQGIPPEASDDPVPLIQRDGLMNRATDPVLETFVRNAMTATDLNSTSSTKPLALMTTEILIDLVVMILDNLSARVNLDDQQQKLTGELHNLRWALQSTIREDVTQETLGLGTSTALVLPGKISDPRSLTVCLHELLWDAAYILGIYSKRDSYGRVSIIENLEGIISTINGCRINVIERLRANMYDITNPADLQARIHLRPDMSSVQLDLTHPGRVVLYQEDIFRLNQDSRWQETRVFLFDNYMVQAKPSLPPHGNQNAIGPDYDVTKLPIPMYLLILDSPDDETPPKNEGAVSGPSGIIWPFRVRHLGHNQVYTFGTLTLEGRQNWCSRIIEGKTQHARSLREQRAEPFQVKVIADKAFTYDKSPFSVPLSTEKYKTAIIQGTPLSRAIQNLDKEYRRGMAEPTRISRGNVTCATVFRQPQDGAQVVVVGDLYGVYFTDYNAPRGWTRAFPTAKVTQIIPLEDFNLLLLLTDKSLVAYSLDTVCLSTSTRQSVSSAPQKLSSRSVNFFAIGHMAERTLLFYQYSEGLSSVFKVLEVMNQRSSLPQKNLRDRIRMKTMQTDFFRDYDAFYIPSDTYGINLFRSSIAISAAKGIEVVTLDRKMPFAIPDLQGPNLEGIAARIRDLKPLGMFRLDEHEFLLVYEEVALYVNKHGDLSRSVIMEFLGKAKQACLVDSSFLVLIDQEGTFVQVRDAMNGRLKQIIYGKDIRLLYDGMNSADGNLMITMQHPNYEWAQMVLELIVDPEHKVDSVGHTVSDYKQKLTETKEVRDTAAAVASDTRQ